MPRWTLRRGNETVHVEVVPQGGRWHVRVEASDGSPMYTADVVVWAMPPRFFMAGLEGPREVFASVAGSEVWVAGAGDGWSLAWTPYARAPSRSSRPTVEEIRAPMTGRLIDLRVRPGQAVEAGAVLLVIEAMKMEVQVQAPQAAVVTDVRVRPGAQVDQGQVLLCLQARSNGTEAKDGGDSDY